MSNYQFLPYKGQVKVLVPDPLAQGGKGVNDNFKALADADEAINTKISASTATSVSGLMSIAPQGDGHRVQVGGHYADGDGGGGLFYWDATSVAPENFGTVIRSTVASSSGRWKRIIQAGRIYARWFGAKGDGNTDDTVA